MKMKALITAAVAALGVASAAHAATVTYILSLDDNGTGTATAGSYAVYAYASAGDNLGLAAYQYTITGGGTTVTKGPQQTFTDSNGVNNDYKTGFGSSRHNGTGTTDATTATQDTVDSPYAISYGIGQTAGNLNNTALPNGYDTRGATAPYGVTNSFTVANSTGTATATNGEVPVLVGTGTFSGTTPSFVTTGALGIIPAANVIITASQPNAATPLPPVTTAATIGTVTRDLIATPEPASLSILGVAGIGMLTRRRKTA